MIAEQRRATNGHSPSDPRPFLNFLAEDDRRMERLAEAIDLAQSMIDPMEAYRDGNETWLPMGSGFTGGGTTGAIDALSEYAGSVLTIPRQLGPTTRMPCDRAMRTTRSRLSRGCAV